MGEEGGGGLRMGHGGVRGGGHSYYYPLSGPFLNDIYD